MEDVVVHYQPGSAAGLSSLLEKTEKLLECFPCRTPPAFTPWFPMAPGCHLPIRPARPAPTITASENRPHTPPNPPKKPGIKALFGERPHQCLHGNKPPQENPQEPRDDVSETPDCVLAASLFPPVTREVIALSLDKHKQGFPIAGSPPRRSWSAFMHGGMVLQRSQPLSKPFSHMVSAHRLHPRQRVKWVISEHNCGAFGDIEQVWTAVSRSVQRAQLPTCNANIQREQAEIWVFCDVVCSEQVGRFLKEQLQLSGSIRLTLHRRGDVFSM